MSYRDADPCPETGDDDCLACSGEACWLCGAGCWSDVDDCEHEVVDRHTGKADPTMTCVCEIQNSVVREKGPKRRHNHPITEKTVILECETCGALWCDECKEHDGRWSLPIELNPIP